MEKKPALAPELVQEFVGVAHGDLNRVRELLGREPALLNAAWDWGGGDWETALGAAAHMGRKDIARDLLARGARIDLFAAAMLGRLEIVRAILEADPGARNSPGPHGIPLMAHAKAGGEEAAVVVRYLEGDASGDSHEVHGLEPVLLVRDVAAAVEYYVSKLGFAVDFVWGEPPSHARVMRGDRATGGPIRLQLSQSSAEIIPSGWQYILVGADLDGLCAEYRANGVTITDEPETFPWEMREFAIVDNNGHRLRFAQEV